MSELIETLKENIRNKNTDEAKQSLKEIHTSLLAGNHELAAEITNPPVITELHKLLKEELEVPHRVLLLPVRVPNRMRRAILFVRAMANGVDRVSS